MWRRNIFRGSLSFRDKILSLDYFLIFLILSLGIISFFAMYSTEQGNYGYFTQNHVYRFSIFFTLFIILSFFKIQFWFKFSYLFYFIVIILLLSVDLFGVSSSGSKRWIGLLFINLQPSELMKIALIAFLARYYYKVPVEKVTNIKYIFVPFIILIVPVYMVASQPDLGTSLLIAIGGISIMWLAGFSIKYFLYSSLARFQSPSAA